MKGLSILKIAHVFNVDRGTIYTWIRRGCPIEESGRQGKPAQGSFLEVLDWRRSDLAAMSVDCSRLEEMERRAKLRYREICQRGKQAKR